MAQVARKGIFFVMLALGAFLQQTTLFAPYHELCHQHAATMSKIESRIVAWDRIELGEATPYILAAGYFGEAILFMGIFFFFFWFFSPLELGIRRHWYLAGIPLGVATWAWLTPLLVYTHDFCQRPEWTATMRLAFLFAPGCVVAFGWLLVFAFRLRRR